jgi:hypothetical protein
MSDYKKMYYTIFKSTTKAINILYDAQKKTEEMYLAENSPDIRLFDNNKHKKNNEKENEE